MKRWQNNIPEYLISPLTTGFRKISIGVVKDSYMERHCTNSESIKPLESAFLLP
ncbi:hypothetical protein [Endozoicomonas atrinae]|uniref:hypothetical protein n=1 Tax=Endozoicomonas atrinae TaxID=1333660 RepID=UPI003B00F342